jgi:hypothetical protein
MYSGSAQNMNCSMPANMTIGTSEFFFDTICVVYDEVLRLATNGTAPRLNCSACPGMGSGISCTVYPKDPTCEAYFNSTPCGQNTTIASNYTLCKECVLTVRPHTLQEAAIYRAAQYGAAVCYLLTRVFSLA